MEQHREVPIFVLFTNYFNFLKNTIFFINTVFRWRNVEENKRALYIVYIIKDI